MVRRQVGVGQGQVRSKYKEIRIRHQVTDRRHIAELGTNWRQKPEFRVHSKARSRAEASRHSTSLIRQLPLMLPGL